MHRKRTRFAARAHRLATAVERRGIVATYEVHDRLLANRAARRRFAQDRPTLDATQRAILSRLREDGYATVSFSELIPKPEAWRTLERDASAFVAETEAALAREAAGATDPALRRREGKEFVVRRYAYGAVLRPSDPWLAFGLNRRLLDIANSYLGMWSKLEYVDVWYTPAAGTAERRSSQRWHRDFNDRHLLKAFLYLVDVDEGSGPFEYVPRTAPGGELAHLWPWRPLGENYPPDDALDAQIRDRAVTFTAPKGTLIFCNTAGFHRGGFATTTPRVLATVTYSSPASLASLTERNYSLDGASADRLAPTQRYALG